MMNRNLACFGVLVYFLVSILSKHKCLSIRCYDCDHCPRVSNISISKDECAKCLVGGVGSNTDRRCLYSGQTIPPGFPKEGQEVCDTDLCNGKTTGTPGFEIENPISCYVCKDCGKDNERIEKYCGACVIHKTDGKVVKLCLPNCEGVPKNENTSCCTTNLCNGMTNVIVNKNIIVFLLLLTLMRAYTM
uniref:Uncharacterized protein n=1 Tax=Trichobilharzia regenti TaxID=157069 RepID=A0AA85K2B1_TRIRE|nr:unnamed protein product [Trichobilharzia regenti]